MYDLIQESIILNYSNRISNRYYNIPPIGGYSIDEEHEYILPEQDDIASLVFLDIVTRFGNQCNDLDIKLKKIKYYRVKENDKVMDNDCSICLSCFSKNEYHRTLECGHVFHKKCIDKWFKCNHSDCPMCRTKVIN
jgi:hypothetical protein